MELRHYWLFAATCIALAILMFRLVIKERVTLQASLSFLLVLLLTASVAVFPQGSTWLAVHIGFTLPSNFFFAGGIAALAFLHLMALIHLSRAQLRTVTLTQELAILQEKVDRILQRTEHKGSAE